MITDRFVPPQDKLAKFVSSKQKEWLYHRNYNKKKRKIMRKDTGLARITYTEKVGSQTEEIRLKEFNKTFDYNATIFRCNTCLSIRKYGHGKPERSLVMLICEHCKKHTWHSYLEIWRTRGNYAGISNNS